MNILGAITVEFIKELKQSLKGWRIEPYLIVELDKHTNIPTLNWVLWRPPQGKSATDFFVEKMLTERQHDDKCYLLIRRPKSELRLIKLSLAITTVQLCHLTYYRASGWRQNEVQVRYSGRFRPKGQPPPPVYEQQPDHLVLTTCQFYHISDGPSKRRPTTLLKNAIDLADPESLPRVAALAAKVLTKSFGKTYYVRGNVKLSSWDGEIGVNVEGRNRILYKFPSNSFDHMPTRLLT